MTKYAIVEFVDGIQMVPTSWLQTDNICLWPNYTNQLKINKAIAQLEVPSSTWSEQRVLRSFGTAKTHGEGMIKLKLAEKLSDVDTAASDEETLTGKRGRHLRAKRCISSSDDDDIAAPPSKKKLPPFPKMPKDFVLSNSAAIQRLAEERAKGQFVENCEDGGRQKNSFPTEEYTVTERCEGHSAEDSEGEWTNVTTPSSSFTQNEDTIGLSESLRIISRSFTGNAVLEAKSTNSSESIKKNTPRPDIVNTPQFRTSNKLQDALRESSKNKKIPKFDELSQESETLGVLKDILRKLIRISYRLRAIEEKLDDQIDKNVTEDDETWKELGDYDFPIKTQEALEKIEEALKNKTYFSKMVEFMKSIGGSAANASVVNILKYTVSDLIAKEYSWSGARKKKAFGELNICRMLIKTVRSAFTTITNDDIKGVASKWLAQATLRYTRQTEKSERVAENKVSSEEGKDAPDE